MIVLKKPVLSEKSMRLAKDDCFTFLVDKKARKLQILKAVKRQFDVEPIEIRTANFKAEIKMQRRKRGYFIVSGFKKAIVKLKKGQKIPLFQTEAGSEEMEQESKVVKEKKSLLKGTKVKVEKEMVNKSLEDKTKARKLQVKKGEK